MTAKFYASPSFTLAYSVQGKWLEIFMQVHGPVLNTSHLPHTLSFLETHFPEVLKTKCFNDHNYTFRQEVINTEIAHLFEHILLQNLYMAKASLGHTEAVFSGTTTWNWNKQPLGSFHVKISYDETDVSLLKQAMAKTIGPTEELFSLGQTTDYPQHSLAVNTPR